MGLEGQMTNSETFFAAIEPNSSLITVFHSFPTGEGNAILW